MIQTYIYIYIYIYEVHSINKGCCFFSRKYVFFFFRISFILNENCIVWNWFIVKFILILQNIFVPIQIAKNPTAYSRLDQRSLIQYLVAEKCKSCEIHRRIRDSYREANFSQRKYYNNSIIRNPNVFQ